MNDGIWLSEWRRCECESVYRTIAIRTICIETERLAMYTSLLVVPIYVHHDFSLILSVLPSLVKTSGIFFNSGVIKWFTCKKKKNVKYTQTGGSYCLLFPSACGLTWLLYDWPECHATNKFTPTVSFPSRLTWWELLIHCTDVWTQSQFHHHQQPIRRQGWVGLWTLIN